MNEWQNNQQGMILLRIICIVFGAAAITVALLADRLGFGQSGSFGSGQLLLVLSGIVILLISLLGHRIVSLYRGVAIILLNTLVLLGCLELGAIIIARSGVLPSYRQTIFATYQDIPYYTRQDWAEVYWREARLAEDYHYEPYVVWRHLPFEGETVHINQEGNRQTPGAACSEDSYTVFVFGGSTMWGWGSPDWGTITAFLQVDLKDLIEGPVCVVNFGEDGFVSSQSVIELIRQLQSGRVPDGVVFYDGANDIYAAHESGRVGAHVNLATIASKFEEREHILAQWFKSSRQFSLFEQLVDRLKSDRPETQHVLGNGTRPDLDTDHLARSIVDLYLSNYRIVGGLAREYGFDYYFFWQPHLAVAQKPLTVEEQKIRRAMDPQLNSLVAAVYNRMSSLAPSYGNLWYIANAFEGRDEQIWIDTWGHVTPEGNRLIAREILVVIDDQLAEE